LLQNPDLGRSIEDFSAVRTLRIEGVEVLIKMIEVVQNQPEQTTARLLELFRDSPFHGYLERLAMRANYIDEDVLESQFRDTVNRLLESQTEGRRLELLEKSRQSALNSDEKDELLGLLSARIDQS
jgi:DNA primase